MPEQIHTYTFVHSYNTYRVKKNFMYECCTNAYECSTNAYEYRTNMLEKGNIRTGFVPNTYGFVRIRTSFVQHSYNIRTRSFCKSTFVRPKSHTYGHIRTHSYGTFVQHSYNIRTHTSCTNVYVFEWYIRTHSYVHVH